MTIDYPTEAVGLRQLWKEAFGDSDAFLDIFFNHGYSRRRCRCITDGGTVGVRLYDTSDGVVLEIRDTGSVIRENLPLVL